jgi:hypothetical protein
MAHSHEGHASCGPSYASPREPMEKAEHEKVLYTMAGALRRDRHSRAGLSGHVGCGFGVIDLLALRLR